MSEETILPGESDNIEYKVDIPPQSDKYMKTVVAFANGTGGKLVFGVEDKTWRVVGFSKEDVYQKVDAITNAILDNCEPKIVPRIEAQEINGRSIIVVEIVSGMQRPYFIKSQDMIAGTYVRVSGTTRHAERYRLQELILDGMRQSYDQVIKERKLTKSEIKTFCEKLYQHALSLCLDSQEKKKIRKVTKNQLLSWRLLVEKDNVCYPTNGYLLLNGDTEEFPDATIQCAVFKGTTRNIFITRKEFSGALYEQIENAYVFVLQHINLNSKIVGVGRQDLYELPPEAVREMIANAVCHRSYLTPGKIQVALYDDRLEVTSPGMLDSETTIEKMKTGRSKIRNKAIGAAFSYMNVIEGWGSRIPRIFALAKEYRLREPELIDLGSDFRVNLYRGVVSDTLNGENDTLEGHGDTLNDENDTLEGQGDTLNGENDTLSARVAVLKLIAENPKIKQTEIVTHLMMSLSTVKRVMSKLQKDGKIFREGGSRNGLWKIKE